MKAKTFDLANPQQSIWLTEQFYQGTSINNICGTVHIHEKVDFEKLQKAIQLFVKENDSFRIRLFYDETNEIKQYIASYEPFSVKTLVLEKESDLSSLENEMVCAPFSLFEKPLFSFLCFTFSDGTGGFVVNAHHLIADACSAGLLASKVITIYSSLLHNTPYQENPSSYVDYIYAEKEYLTSNKFEKDKTYWNSVFETVPEIGTIPSTQGNTLDDCAAKRSLFVMPQEKVEQIHSFCNEHKISIFNFFMGIYAVYIGRVCGLEDFVLGTPILNRTTFAEKNTPGMFISTVPFRFMIDPTSSFVLFAKKIAMDALGLFRHQKYPYQSLLEDIRKKNPSTPNLYDILISYQNTKTNRNSSDVPYNVHWTFNHNVADSLQIHLFDMNDEGSLNIAYDYRLVKYSEFDITSIHDRILHMVDQVLHCDTISLQEIEIVTPEEKKLVLEQFNTTFLPYPKEKTIVDFFEEQVKKTPDRIAMVFENHAITYRELNQKANSLAYLLHQKGIKANDIIGVMLHRSIEMMVALLAVLKAGAAYIPIDPDYPEERIAYMLENSDSPCLLTQDRLSEKIKTISFKGEAIFVDFYHIEIFALPQENLSLSRSSDDLSYLIYTSGSTGTPKGVMLTHRNLTNFICSMKEKIAYLKDEQYHSIVSITTVSFDIFAFESLVSLCHGLKVFMTNEEEQKITLKLERLISENHIEILQTTPSIMNFHMEHFSLNVFSCLRYLMLAGEPLPLTLVQKIRAFSPNCTIYNGYGPSETTIFSTVQDVSTSKNITIGKPIHNTFIYILDQYQKPLPPHVLGEIYISGDGVGNGYLHRPDLTDERYFPDPFHKGYMVYRTGDTGFWLKDGSIECHGRVDHQVKLHGLRIELGEIEECINSFHPLANIKSAVLVKEEGTKTGLHAFLTSSVAIDTKELREYLSSKLPNYMIPSTFTVLEQLPFTPNGKIDRKVLSHYAIPEAEPICSFTPARNSTEKVILQSIQKKLCLDEFGIDSNIFDYGADSLTIISILTDLFPHNLNLKVYDFYQHPTVRDLYDSLLSENEIQAKLNPEKYFAIDDWVKKCSKSTSPVLLSTHSSILLTGATGFLGAHLLAYFLDHPNHFSKIYCAIRKKDKRSVTQRLLDRFHFYFGNLYDERIVHQVECIPSDINEEGIGLDSTHLDALRGKIDCVLHCAANVKHYGNYFEFEKTNIKGTKHMIEFCKELHVPLHYISTMTISGNYLIEQKQTQIVFDENTFFAGQSFDDNVYSKSKLIAESLVLQAMKEGSLQATIYRIGDLAGRLSDGVFQKNIEENSIYLRLRSLLQMATVPDTILNNSLEFSPVDKAAEAIGLIMTSSEPLNRIFHIYNPHMLKVSRMLDYLKQLAYNISILSKEDFLTKMKQLGEDEKSQSKISGIINDFTRDNDFIYNHIMPTQNQISCAYLQSLGFEWPDLSLSYIEKLLSYMKEVHFLEEL